MRGTSFKILYDVFYKKTLLNDAINNAFIENIKLKEEDKAFVKRETTGVIEKLDDIDNVINRYSKVKAKKLNNDVLIAIRMGVYELIYMDKVPVYATINECVNLIKKSKSYKYAAYVNAVLRNIERNEKKDFIDEKNNCYFRIYGDNEKVVLDELNKKNVSYSKYDGTLDFIKTKVYKVGKFKEILDTLSFKKGHVLIEDASSIYMVDKLVSFFKGNEKTVLDTCSAPGGKILSFVDLFPNVSAIACDISDAKVSKINENIKRLNVKNIITEVRDATKYDITFDNRFDAVICDVPCTGLGVIDRKPDIKLNYSEEKCLALAKIQRDILDVSKNYVKVGGILSYSTCTETKEENIENINWFLLNNSNFEKIYEKQILRGDENKACGFYFCFMRRSK